MNILVKRIDCWNDTLKISTNLPSPPPSLKIQYAKQFTFYKKHKKSNIQFFDMDAIDCCLRHSPNALVLNLADDIEPGGCVFNGSGAQEEALFRRTNYCVSLKNELYPIKKNEVIYSPNISVFKKNENTEWQLLDMNNLPTISFIACPGIKYPETELVSLSEKGVQSKNSSVKSERKLNKKDSDVLKMKIITILQTAAIYNHDTIIMGALGCGAWDNPPKHVAEIFKEVLDTYDGVIKNIYFAILTTKGDIIRNNGETKTNIDIFREVFGV